jgi:mono/diheme cytochrome c family protein
MKIMRGTERPLLPYAGRLAAAGLLAVAVLSGPAAADARFDYLLHCGGCHLENGSGSPPEVPDLRLDLDTLLTIPGGRAYLASVPGAAQAPLSDAQLAAVLNWIIEVYYADLRDFRPFSPEEIAGYRGPSMLDPLRYRAELLARHR